MRWFLLALCACATAAPQPARVDWVAVDAAIREARWRTDHCADPNSPKCDALWLVKDEIGAILKAQRDALGQGQQ